MPPLSSDMAFSIGLAAGWVALVIQMMWVTGDHHECHDLNCPKKKENGLRR